MAYVKNDFPMRDWHFEHMKKMIAKYVRGIPEDATGWEKKYGKRFTCTFARKQIEYDIKHGVSLEETLSAFQAIRSKPEYASLRKFPNWIERLAALEGQFDKPGMSTMGSYAGGLEARGY